MRNRRIRIELTLAEAEALLASNGHTLAGELTEVFQHGREINAFERADNKIRAALSAVHRAGSTGSQPSGANRG